MNKITRKNTMPRLTAGLVLVVSAAMAQAGAATSATSPSHAAQAAQMASGEIKQIDKETAKLTIKHGPLVNLNMPPMTMVFKVRDAAMLEKVKVGDNVSFHAEKVNGALTVTNIEPSTK